MARAYRGTRAAATAWLPPSEVPARPPPSLPSPIPTQLKIIHSRVYAQVAPFAYYGARERCSLLFRAWPGPCMPGSEREGPRVRPERASCSPPCPACPHTSASKPSAGADAGGPGHRGCVRLGGQGRLRGARWAPPAAPLHRPASPLPPPLPLPLPQPAWSGWSRAALRTSRRRSARRPRPRACTERARQAGGCPGSEQCRQAVPPQRWRAAAGSDVGQAAAAAAAGAPHVHSSERS